MSTRIKELEKENFKLRNALHDAINRPKGVVPDSACEFYEPEKFYPPSIRGGLTKKKVVNNG